ncbi:peroxisome biogenesis protein 16 isoform X2 [Aristolochia californica]
MPTGPADPSSSWSLWISIIKDLETLIEVAAQHFYGDDKKWNFLAFTEATKVLVRLALFRDSGYKMLLHGGEDVNVEKDHNAADRGMGDFARPMGYDEGGPGYNGYGPRGLEGRAMFALSRLGENAKMVSSPSWMKGLQSHQAPMMKNRVIEKPTISTILSEKGLFGGLFLAAESLFILRPLIYVLFIRRYRVRSWLPWSLSLVVDLVGMGILSHVTDPCHGRKTTISLSISEKDEVKRRKLVWALYLMRDPFFSKYTRHCLESTEKRLAPVPFIGFLTAKLVELIVGAQTRYTYMSGS